MPDHYTKTKFNSPFFPIRRMSCATRIKRMPTMEKERLLAEVLHVTYAVSRSYNIIII